MYPDDQNHIRPRIIRVLRAGTGPVATRKIVADTLRFPVRVRHGQPWYHKVCTALSRMQVMGLVVNVRRGWWALASTDSQTNTGETT